MKTSVFVGLVALAGAACGASASGTLLQEFSLHDHPGGNANPPPYGLRFDGLFGGGITTFSFDFHSDTTLNVFDQGGGNLEIVISGTVHGGEVDGSGGYLSSASYALEFIYAANVSTTSSGYSVSGMDIANTGSLTELDGGGNPTGASYSFFGKPNDSDVAFLLQSDGHRIPGDDSSWVGRGWLSTVLGQDASGAQDFLFVAKPIPTPGALMLGAAGMLFAGRRRR